MENNEEMYVVKRDGTVQTVQFDKILTRVRRLGKEANLKINYTNLAMKVIDQIYNNIPTTKLDELCAEQCASLASTHPDYNALAGRIVVSNHHKNTTDKFSEAMRVLVNMKDIHGEMSPLIAADFYQVVERYSAELNAMCCYDRDYLIDYFGFKTLERAYLMRANKKIVERPQHMWLRVAVAIHALGVDLEEVPLDAIKETYDYMSQKYFTHATPTLFNAGTPHPQLSSCYLLSMENDSIDGIYNTLKDCALISKWAGGIGLHIHNVRASGSHIRGTNGTSNGIVPMLRVFNNTAKYVDQGGGKRNGSFAIYLEPWHADIEAFLQMRKNHGDEELKARDLFYALWIPDLFMERVKAGGKWTLMCPNECPGLADVYGEQFVELYCRYENEGRGRKTVNARDLWFQVLDAQMETGTPYLLYKDAANKKSNQKNIGTIKSSNLCVAGETLILTDKGHIRIDTLVGEKVNVWNGEEWSEVEVKQTGVMQDLIEVHTDDGLTLSCTPYHKFYVQNEYSLNSVKQVEAMDLKPGDKLLKSSYPVIDGTDEFLYAYTHGFFCGDGTYRNVGLQEPTPCKFNALSGHYFCKRHIDNETQNYLNNTENKEMMQDDICNALSYTKIPIIQLYDEKIKLIDYLDKRNTYEKNRNVVNLPLDINEKYDVPSDNCSLKTKLEWFAGYCDADGTIARNGENTQLQVASINKDFLIRVKWMLQTCGINPKLKLAHDRKHSYLPDGKGSHKYYNTKTCYRLLCSSCDLHFLKELGFSPKRLVLSDNKPTRDAKQFIKILKIENNNRADDTYCFTEPKRHMGIFNGILTGQCTEIIEYSDEKETAVCNLASIALPMFVNQETKTFDYEKLHAATKVVTNNLNKVIDINFYPTEKTKRSNLRHRPIGIGVQGLADTFMLLDLPFYSDEAKQVNRLIFETIYHAALEKSCEISKDLGDKIRNVLSNAETNREKEYAIDNILRNEYDVFHFSENMNDNLLGAYSTFVGSPASQGILQYDMWGVEPTPGRYDWDALKLAVKTYGIRNSLLVAPMPTASTSQILGFNECIEPITSNIYSRRTLAGEFILANRYLIEDLMKLDLWNDKIKQNIIANNGSVQHIDIIPLEIRNKYKTVWEMPMRNLIDMSADRGAFICQSQSLNLWLEDPNYNMLTSMHFYSWSKGLKTGIYYLRRRGKHQAQQFTVEPEKAQIQEDEHDICEYCSA